MAKSLDQVNLEKEVQANEGASTNTEDLEIAVLMAQDMLANGGMQVIEDAINQSEDPAMVIGQFLGQLIGQLAEGLMEQFPDFDARVFLAKDGWLDIILDHIEDELGYPDNFSDQIYSEVLELIKAAASSPEAPNNVMGVEEEEGDLPAQPLPPAPAAQPMQPGMPRAGGMM